MNKVRAVLARLTPVRVRRVLELLQVFNECILDAFRHVRHSAPTDATSAIAGSSRHLECQLTRDYHRIEKGLALREPRPGFGDMVSKRIRRDIGRLPHTTANRQLLSSSVRALDGLDEWNSTGLLPSDIDGPVLVRRSNGALMSPSQAQKFFSSRSSVRDFSDRSVEGSAISSAVSLALWSPSVCNRQAWFVYSFYGASDVSKILQLQNGNGGFGDRVPCALVVTVDLRLFSGSGERNQRYIDGGLFAMSLVWALHAQGLVTCMLNWSVNNRRSAQLRSIAGIPEWQDIITMVAVGYAPEEYRVARSVRRPVEDVLIFPQLRSD